MWTWIGANSRGNLTGGVATRIGSGGQGGGCGCGGGLAGCIGLFVLLTVLWFIAQGFIGAHHG
jgi:hypothetical protein